MGKAIDQIRDLGAPSMQGVRPAMPTSLTLVGAAAVLYLARDVFLPIAVALLLTFALAPVVAALRRIGLPRAFAVISTALITFTLIGIFSLIVALQVAELAKNLPAYQSNIVMKVKTLKEAGSENGIIDRIGNVVERINREINRPTAETPIGVESPARDPLLVEIYSRDNPIQVLTNIIAPLIGPVAMAGLVVVVVIFMLLEREDLRDRFIRLAGFGDLHRTTEGLQDAGTRVGHYLLMQLIVNSAYGLPVAVGLWFIGIPNAVLWGLLAIVLRFVPYIGPIIAMVLPLFLSVAVDSGWSMLLWTAGLFVAMELVINNVVEPMLYGSKTGLSPLAIIVSAIFWAWIWGPVGLILSTPLTVCLVVLGKHVPQFEFLQVLFGSDPVLAPHARLYQRLLAGDPDEGTDQAEEILEEEYLVDYYAAVAMPALALAEQDRARGVMNDEQRLRVAASGMSLVSNLEDIAIEESQDDDQGEVENLDEKGEPANQPIPDGEGMTILCVGGRGEIDDVSAAMLAQVLRAEGAAATALSFHEIEPANIRKLHTDAIDAIVVCFLNRDSIKHARFVVRRLKRVNANARVGIVIWDTSTYREAGQRKADISAEEMPGADFVASDMTMAAIEALTKRPSIPLATPSKTKARRRLVPQHAQ
ncbi:ABC transporter permease [Ensifer adhaerens]|uniref:ABC transporter permease n=1 Tax=Ensifer adhaerens TaxID=106592 RepID=A0A0L8BDX6_ENSAD|nr:ABC transporter permease [Ensifer adhaerens]